MVTSPAGLPPTGLSASRNSSASFWLIAFTGHGVALGILLALEFLHRLDQDFRIGHQIGPDALAEIGGNGRGGGRRAGDAGALDDVGQAGAGRDDGADDDQAAHEGQ